MARVMGACVLQPGMPQLMKKMQGRQQQQQCNRFCLSVEASRKSKAAEKREHDAPTLSTSLPLLEEFSAGKSTVPKQQKSLSNIVLPLVEEDRNGSEWSLEEFLESRSSVVETEVETLQMVPKNRTFLRKKRADTSKVKNRIREKQVVDADERVEVWEGEGAPMTPEEEAAFMAEVRKEIAELDERKRGEGDHSHPKMFEDWDDEDGSEGRSRARNSVPVVMRCFDRAKIYVKAGDGGSGEVAFRREKFVPFGGPSGGCGGRGGNVYIEVDGSLNSLLSFRKCIHFRGGRGNRGLGKGQDGAFGEDCVVKVPPGTLVREVGDEPGSGKTLLELTKPGQKEVLLPGGRGGRGNVAFKSTKNKAPQISENGEEGAGMWIELELKLVADVGIVGVPNAGKSTLLSSISAARPEIAAYPFTTLLPNLGVVSLSLDETMVVADLPGLLEGAHNGYGLGHEFLRHTERCRVLVHVIDGLSEQAECEYEAVRLELQLFNPILSSKPCVVAYNKMDIPEVAERWPRFKQAMEAKGVAVFSMSAATMKGTSEVVRAAYELLKTAPEPVPEIIEEDVNIAERVRRERAAPIGEFTVVNEPGTRVWHIEGAGLERFVQMTNWEYFESRQRFERVLQCSGVNAELRKQGIKEGDQVVIAERTFNWNDSKDVLKDIVNIGKFQRSQRGSKHWPH